MAAIVDGIYYGCKTKYVEKCVKHGIKIILFINFCYFKSSKSVYPDKDFSIFTFFLMKQTKNLYSIAI